MEEEEKEPIESFTIISQLKKINRPLVTNVKFRPDIKKKLKEMFSDALIYLDSATYNQEKYQILKKMLDLNFNDINNSFIYFKNPYALMIGSKVPPTKTLYLDFFNSRYRSHYYQTNIEIEINCYVGGVGVLNGFHSRGTNTFFQIFFDH